MAKKKFSSYDLEQKIDCRLRVIPVEPVRPLDFSSIRNTPRVEKPQAAQPRSDVVNRLIEVIKAL